MERIWVRFNYSNSDIDWEIFKIENASIYGTDNIQDIGVNIYDELKDYTRECLDYIVWMKRCDENIGEWIIDDWTIAPLYKDNIELLLSNATDLADLLITHLQDVSKTYRESA